MPMYAVSPSKFHNDQTSAPTTLNTQFFNHAATAAETRPTIQKFLTLNWIIRSIRISTFTQLLP